MSSPTATGRTAWIGFTRLPPSYLGFRRGAPLTEEEARLLESWEQEDGIFKELVIADGTHI
jgi:hypothetical protein